MYRSLRSFSSVGAPSSYTVGEGDVRIGRYPAVNLNVAAPKRRARLNFPLFQKALVILHINVAFARLGPDKSGAQIEAVLFCICRRIGDLGIRARLQVGRFVDGNGKRVIRHRGISVSGVPGARQGIIPNGCDGSLKALSRVIRHDLHSLADLNLISVQFAYRALNKKPPPPDTFTTGSLLAKASSGVWTDTT